MSDNTNQGPKYLRNGSTVSFKVGRGTFTGKITSVNKATGVAFISRSDDGQTFQRQTALLTKA